MPVKLFLSALVIFILLHEVVGMIEENKKIADSPWYFVPVTIIAIASVGTMVITAFLIIWR